eukprot:7666270-Pyramimonas_sp.AAC.1
MPKPLQFFLLGHNTSGIVRRDQSDAGFTGIFSRRTNHMFVSSAIFAAGTHKRHTQKSSHCEGLNSVV